MVVISTDGFTSVVNMFIALFGVVYVEFISFCFRLTLDTKTYMMTANAIANAMHRMI